MSRPGDWLVARATPAMLEACLARQRFGDEHEFGLVNVQVGSRTERARGHVAEWIVRRWLDVEGVPYRAGGGVSATIPDLEVCGVRVGVKCRKAKRGFTFDSDVNVAESHLGRVDEWLFVGYEVERDRYLVLGAALERDVAGGEFVPAGAHRWGREVGFACRLVPVRAMIPPRAWLDSVAGRN